MAIQSDIAPKAVRLPPGIYVPAIALFKDSKQQEIDVDAAYAHYSQLIRGGSAGVVIQGTNGEAVLLSPEEKIEYLKAGRKAATDLGLPDYPILAGISGQSTNETIRLAKEAKDAGANFALLLPPSYWAKAVTNEVLNLYYTEVADNSPLPIVIYNVSEN